MKKSVDKCNISCIIVKVTSERNKKRGEKKRINQVFRQKRMKKTSKKVLTSTNEYVKIIFADKRNKQRNNLILEN